MRPIISRRCWTSSLFLLVVVAACLLTPVAAAARVVRVEVTSREVLEDSPELQRSGPYEIIKGVIHLEVDPDDPANGLIVDLQLAPRNASGKVELSTDFELHKPVDPARGNQRLLYFVNNRGNKMGNWHFNHGAGGNWLYRQGWSYLWTGWNCDAMESDRRLNIRVPEATRDGKTITGKAYAEIISFANDLTYSRPFTWGGSVVYPVAGMDKTTAMVTMRPYRWEEPVEVPRDRWEFARLVDGEIVPDSGHLYLKDGFKPGWLYDLVYVASKPKVTGLGMAAIRDVVSFFRYQDADGKGSANPLAGVVEHAYAWGHSQSARLLNHFVHQDFNGDEAGRKVFDGVIANCGGGGRGLFNSRFAQMTRHGSHHEDNLYPIDVFPFTTVKQIDPLTGESGDALARGRSSGSLPRMLFINSSTDYWTRAASLLHTDVAGKKDAGIDPHVRIYAIAGRAHTSDRIGFVGRALLTALDQWVSQDVEPPASEIPRIADGTLVDLETWSRAFPDIPSVRKPPSLYHPYRLDMGPRWQTAGIADQVPPETGPRYVCLVPRVDPDGNEIAGIRLPEVAAPLATFTGWSMRSPSFSDTMRRNAGAVWPFPDTTSEREKDADPRRSIRERYPTKADYFLQLTKSLLSLKSRRFLLDEDVSRLLMEAARLTYWQSGEDGSPVAITEVSARPAELEAGETLVLSVAFEKPAAHILTVRADFREANNLSYRLNDDGQDGDETAGDDIWSRKVWIPSGVPAGQFHLDIRAVDEDLNSIYVKETVKDGVGEAGSLVFTVK